MAVRVAPPEPSPTVIWQGWAVAHAFSRRPDAAGFAASRRGEKRRWTIRFYANHALRSEALGRASGDDVMAAAVGRPWTGRNARSATGRAAALAIAGVLALIALLTSGGPTVALEIEFSARPVKLDILALYDGRHERRPHLTRIHKYAEMPLNYLGYRLHYYDVNGKLPPPATLARYRGILTWFAEPLSHPDALLDWLERALAGGSKYVVLGEPAPGSSDLALPKVNRVLAHIGLEQPSDFVDLTWRVKVIERNAGMIGFERPLDKALPGFPMMRAHGGDAEPHLVLEAPSRSGPKHSIIVATAPGGGYAASGYAIYYEPNTDRDRWTLNPFAFFAHAFGRERRPIPDVTTLDGRRIYFSHIDGDGWNNVSDIEEHREAGRISAEVIEREAIAPYPDLPVSVALIAGDVDPELGGRPESAAVARRLFALPQVEVASHTYTHPFDWQFFEHYDRAEELKRIEEAHSPRASIGERVKRGIASLAGHPAPPDLTDKFIAGSDDLPRTYLRKPFDLELEMKGSLDVAQALAPPGKAAKLLQWSGDTTPFPAAIRELRRIGARNINGGDSRLDSEYPSVTYVPPISRPAGDERQIYAGNSNENTYTNDWTGPYYGFFMLDKTLDNTDLPRRLKPFNLYYHMYSGERPAALAAVRHTLDRARRESVIPVNASGYAAIADDFFGVEMIETDRLSWIITKRGTLSTVRFDDAAKLSLDLRRSEGVLGSTRHADALYVALDPAVPRPAVTLRTRASEEVDRRRSEMPPVALVDSRWRLSDLSRGDCDFEMAAQGYGPGDMTWQTPPGRAYRVDASRNGPVLYEVARAADEAGTLRVSVAASAIEPLRIRFTCLDEEHRTSPAEGTP